MHCLCGSRGFDYRDSFVFIILRLGDFAWFPRIDSCRSRRAGIPRLLLEFDPAAVGEQPPGCPAANAEARATFCFCWKTPFARRTKPEQFLPLPSPYWGTLASSGLCLHQGGGNHPQPGQAGDGVRPNHATPQNFWHQSRCLQTRSCFQPNARAQRSPGMFTFPTSSSSQCPLLK